MIDDRSWTTIVRCVPFTPDLLIDDTDRTRRYLTRIEPERILLLKLYPSTGLLFLLTPGSFPERSYVTQLVHAPQPLVAQYFPEQAMELLL